MFERIYEILVSFLGESKMGYYDRGTTQYQFNSPWKTEENGGIPDGKYNLEVSFSIFKYHEWTMDYGGDLSKLIRMWGGDSLLAEYRNAISELKELNLLKLNPDTGETVEIEKGIVKLPKTFRKIDISKTRNERLISYLNSRKIDQELIDFYNIGVTGWNGEVSKYRNRVIVPSYDSFGELNYWSGRDYTGKSMSKYWNSDADVNAPKKSEIVFNESKIQFDADIILVEGTFDSIYHPNAVALLGKVITPEFAVYNKLMEKANANVVICLDADTDISDTKKIYKLLNHGRLRNRIYYIRLDKYKDFGEIYENEGKKGILSTLESRKQFHEIELLIN